MGLNLFQYCCTTTPTWTLFILLCSTWYVVVSSDRGLLRDLGLDALPDVTKVNISLDEYTNMMDLYLRQLKDSSSSDDEMSIPKLYTFNSEQKTWRRWNDDDGEEDVTVRLNFPIKPSMSPDVEIDNAEMKLLLPPQNRNSVKVQLYQVLGTRRKRLVREREVFVSQVLNKWCELDVTDIVRNWISGERNLGLELQCKNCKGTLLPLQASISALMKLGNARVRRATPNLYAQNRKTDCVGSRRRKCCRHEMMVTFKELELTQMESIIQPKSYEAGFCRGRCPVNFNHATNHSRIQSLVHRRNKTAMPKVCCAPSKLEPLEILRINPADTQKLMIEKWDNMRVIECACS